MTLRTCIAMVLILCAAGCVPSLHPLYTPQTIVYDPGIAGIWLQDDARWEFVGNPGERSYRLTITEKEDKVSRLYARLVAVNGQRFFDFYPADDAELEGGDWIKAHLVPVHLFFKVEKSGGNLNISAMNPDVIDKLLAQRPGLVKHERVEDDRVVLTDTPENLQKFLLEGLKTDGFFGKAVELTPAEKVVPVAP